MALINLRHIAKIRLECFHFKTAVECSSFDTSTWAATHWTDQLYTSLYCRWLQADNLHTQLQNVYKTATDFAAGDVQKELDSWVDFYGADGEPFDPFSVLESTFGHESVYDLPERIEQYRELVFYVDNLPVFSESKNKVFDSLFGGMTKYYPGKDENGDPVMIAEADLTPEQQEQVRLGQIEEQINDVDAAYALVGYDEFYATCRKLFDTYRPTGNYQACAAGILALFA